MRSGKLEPISEALLDASGAGRGVLCSDTISSLA